MTTKIKWVSPMKVCPTCGVRFRRWSPNTGGVAKNGNHCGSAYCRPCSYAKTVRAQKQPAPFSVPCAVCGVEYTPKRWTMYAKRAYGGHEPQRENFVCSPECLGDALSAFPANPLGRDLCRAPVPGGCQRFSQNAVGKPTGSALCEAHAKRRTRKARLDTPIGRPGQRISA